MQRSRHETHGATVLMVEDNPDVLFLFSTLLRTKVGVQYCNARASGRQLLKLLMEHPDLRPDLILLDLSLPFEDGFSVLSQVRSFFQTLPPSYQPYIIAFTADNSQEIVSQARQAGFDGFIGKPMEQTRFIQQISRVLKGESVWEPW